jgi:hypothetical protein
MSASGSDNHRADRLQFDAWPRDLLAWFDGSALESKTGFTASLVTCEASGRLGTSLLGIGELYAPNAHSLRLALWAQARAAQALAGGVPAALTFVFDGAFYQVQLNAVPMAVEQAEAQGLACFEAALVAGEAQRVPYARLESGIAFTLEEGGREATMRRWALQVEWLKRGR